MPARKSAAKKSGGLSPKTFGGLNKKRMEKKQSGGGRRVQLRQGDTLPVQFLGKPDNEDAFIEFEIHNFQEDGRWYYVPCAGDDCPLCQDDDDKRRRTSYRFATNVWDHKEGKVKILEGPKDLAGRIFYRFERAPEKFLKRVWEVSKFPTTPVSYSLDLAEEKAVSLAKQKAMDLEDYLVKEMEAYYGEDMPSASALDDDDDDDLDDDDIEDEEDDDIEDDDDLDEDEDTEDDDDVEDDEDEDLEDDDLDDEDDDDWDDDEEEEDEEDEEPAPKKRAPAKKAAAKKAAPAKKATAKKAAGRKK